MRKTMKRRRLYAKDVIRRGILHWGVERRLKMKARKESELEQLIIMKVY